MLDLLCIIYYVFDCNKKQNKAKNILHEGKYLKLRNYEKLESCCGDDWRGLRS